MCGSRCGESAQNIFPPLAGRLPDGTVATDLQTSLVFAEPREMRRAPQRAGNEVTNLQLDLASIPGNVDFNLNLCSLQV